MCSFDGVPKSSVIADRQRCDGHWDCVTDEFDCPGEDRFTCVRGSTTIAGSETCDEIRQCADGSDEAPELCPGRFECDATNDYQLDYAKFTYSVELHGPRFIPAAQRCDGTEDCKLGEDESDFACRQ